MVGSVEMPVESDRPTQIRPTEIPTTAVVEIRMLGPLTIARDGVALSLPASRKARGLFTYLALAPHPVPRMQLCELLWDVPNDPRGELRWCLSKIRSLIDEPGRRRVDTQADTVRLDLTDCFVDAIEVARTAQHIETTPSDHLRAMAALFNGDFLDGMEIDRSPAFNTWLSTQRRRFRGCHIAMLERLVQSTPANEALRFLEIWLERAPFDPRVHQRLLNGFAHNGQIREAEDHLQATKRLFETEDIDFTPIRDAWNSARAQKASPAAASSTMAPLARSSDVGPAAGVNRPLEQTDPGRENISRLEEQGEIITIPSRRASILVMPFTGHTATSMVARNALAPNALAHDVITRIAKLRNLFVIAQGTAFSLHEQRISPAEAGRMLDVDYVVHGSVQHQDKRLIVTIEMAEAPTARIVWVETFDHKLDDTLLFINEIGNRIAASIANEIEANERNRAVLRPPNSLDAWEAYHRGLWHMYRFTRPDNEQAMHLFEMAVRLDPTFARAHAGLSFSHFQNAFQNWAPRTLEIDRAFEAAGQSLMADDRDPAAHWAMGRALWLRGAHDPSVKELEQAVDLSPSFALAHYTLAFVQSQAGDPAAAIKASDHSRHLSPFDPLLFAMLGARAMALVRMGRFQEAADWGVKAAARPNAHAHVLAIAAFSLALAGRLDEAHAHLLSIQRKQPNYRIEDFLTAMQLAPDGEKLFRDGARRTGIS